MSSRAAAGGERSDREAVILNEAKDLFRPERSFVAALLRTAD
jgi:hypothetical protein